jgi:hypothetical protein
MAYCYIAWDSDLVRGCIVEIFLCGLALVAVHVYELIKGVDIVSKTNIGEPVQEAPAHSS